jgi:3-dehydroquinate synthase
MGALVVSNKLSIHCSKGEYFVFFSEGLPGKLELVLDHKTHVLIDANVARIYRDQLQHIISMPNTIVIEAIEENKSIQKIIPIFEVLVANKARRDHTLIAIGGGIIQDITCFISSTLFRGISWSFIPTTLLAQADSCIGSKSSINLGKTKNILGTFNPPNKIFIYTNFLGSLEQKDIYSGIGEILKVHAIDSISAFDGVAGVYEELLRDGQILREYIRNALLIKQRYIEVDEFDKGIRNIFNYGHSFGHAIEAATEFAIPHGVAISMGMDMANSISVSMGLISVQHYARMHNILSKNYKLFTKIPIPFDLFFSALMKDKKNTSDNLVLILPVGVDVLIQRVEVSPDLLFQKKCKLFLGGIGA